MGYDTKFTGVLLFGPDMTAKMLAEVNKHLGSDRRDYHPQPDGDWTFIDLELTDDFDGVRWSGAEKTHDMDQAVNWLVDQVRIKFPAFTLNGEMLAQGDDVGDVWRLVVKDGKAEVKKWEQLPSHVMCPKCKHEFAV